MILMGGSEGRVKGKEKRKRGCGKRLETRS